MNFLSRDFLYHRGLSKTTYRGTWNRSNVWRLGSLCLGFLSKSLYFIGRLNQEENIPVRNSAWS